MASSLSDEIINPLQLKELLATNSPPIILDVRERHELKICSLSPCVHIPLGNLSQGWHDLPKDRLIVTLCHHGYRSLQAAQFLKAQGFQHVLNLEGGIHAWAKLVDPEMAVY